MLPFLLAPETILFSAALLLMLAIGLLEAIGLGGSAVDLDFDVSDGGLLDWLGVGRVPVLVLLVAWLAAFGMVGLGGQQAAAALLGRFLSPWVAVPAAAALAVPLAGLLGRLLAGVMPRDETTAIEVGDLAGRVATLTVGRAAAGSPARARVTDRHGQAHHVLVEPVDGATVFEEGDAVLLVQRAGNHFLGVAHEPSGFSRWINR